MKNQNKVRWAESLLTSGSSSPQALDSILLHAALREQNQSRVFPLLLCLFVCLNQCLCGFTRDWQIAMQHAHLHSNLMQVKPQNGSDRQTLGFLGVAHLTAA